MVDTKYLARYKISKAIRGAIVKGGFTPSKRAS